MSIRAAWGGREVDVHEARRDSVYCIEHVYPRPISGPWRHALMHGTAKKSPRGIAGKHRRVVASRPRNPFEHVRVLEPSANVVKHASVTSAEIDRAIRALNARLGKRR